MVMYIIGYDQIYYICIFSLSLVLKTIYFFSFIAFYVE